MAFAPCPVVRRTNRTAAVLDGFVRVWLGYSLLRRCGADVPFRRRLLLARRRSSARLEGCHIVRSKLSAPTTRKIDRKRACLFTAMYTPQAAGGSKRMTIQNICGIQFGIARARRWSVTYVARQARNAQCHVSEPDACWRCCSVVARRSQGLAGFTSDRCQLSAGAKSVQELMKLLTVVRLV